MTLQQSTQAGLNALLGASLTIDGILGAESDQAVASLKSKLSEIFTVKGYAPSAIIGVRMSDEYTNQFSDWGILNINGTIRLFPMSTKPGSSYQKNDTYVSKTGGCACLVPGKYKGMWSYRSAGGWSGDAYLMQVNPCAIYRDKSEGTTIDKSVTETGLFGINFHSWKGDNSQSVDNLSAGCQVEQESVLLEIIDSLNISGNIDYTLLEYSDFNQSA